MRIFFSVNAAIKHFYFRFHSLKCNSIEIYFKISLKLNQNMLKFNALWISYIQICKYSIPNHNQIISKLIKLWRTKE